MLIEEKMSLTHSYKNPFEEINANVLDFKRLVEYWCSPFQYGVLTSFNEHQFRTSEIPIIVQGSRGSGKTTLLKYFSFPAQIERAEIMGYNSLSSMIAEEKEVGFYYRCEDSFIVLVVLLPSLLLPTLIDTPDLTNLIIVLIHSCSSIGRFSNSSIIITNRVSLNDT